MDTIVLRQLFAQPLGSHLPGNAKRNDVYLRPPLAVEERKGERVVAAAVFPPFLENAQQKQSLPNICWEGFLSDYRAPHSLSIVF
jgi:hypothetical protein